MPATPATARAATFTEADAGRTIHVAVGQDVTIVLSSTYWQFDPSSNASVLRPVGEPTYARGSCDLGAGCGTASQVFRAAGPGTAVIGAHRTTCGEALACPPDQATFTMTVSVN